MEPSTSAEGGLHWDSGTDSSRSGESPDGTLSMRNLLLWRWFLAIPFAERGACDDWGTYLAEPEPNAALAAYGELLPGRTVEIQS